MSMSINGNHRSPAFGIKTITTGNLSKKAKNNLGKQLSRLKELAGDAVNAHIAHPKKPNGELNTRKLNIILTEGVNCPVHNTENPIVAVGTVTTHTNGGIVRSTQDALRTTGIIV